jgi:hypothetical protein
MKAFALRITYRSPVKALHACSHRGSLAVPCPTCHDKSVPSCHPPWCPTCEGSKVMDCPGRDPRRIPPLFTLALCLAVVAPFWAGVALIVHLAFTITTVRVTLLALLVGFSIAGTVVMVRRRVPRARVRTRRLCRNGVAKSSRRHHCDTALSEETSTLWGRGIVSRRNG